MFESSFVDSGKTRRPWMVLAGAAFEAALAAAGRPLTYARIDLIRADDGSLRLMELEAIEPDLYLEHAPDGGEAFAKAMRRALEE